MACVRAHMRMFVLVFPGLFVRASKHEGMPVLWLRTSLEGKLCELAREAKVDEKEVATQ